MGVLKGKGLGFDDTYFLCTFLNLPTLCTEIMHPLPMINVMLHCSLAYRYYVLYLLLVE